MNRQSLWIIVAAVLLITPTAFAQLGDTRDGAKASWLNATGGAVDARSPGLMVQQGISRYQERHGFAINNNVLGPTITESEEDESIFQSTRADIINVLFQNLNALIVALSAAIMCRAVAFSGWSSSARR